MKRPPAAGEVRGIEISDRTAICAAQHFMAAHESACTGTPVDWGAVCAVCGEAGRCDFKWTELMAPLFDATGIHPNVREVSPSSPART